MAEKKKHRIKSATLLLVFALLTAVSAVLASLPLKSQPAEEIPAEAVSAPEIAENPDKILSKKPEPVKDLNELLDRIDEIDKEQGLHYSASVEMSEDILLVLYDIMDRLESEGYRFGFVCTDLTTGESICFNEDEKFYAASCIKAFYAASLLKERPELLKNYARQLSRMLIWSSNDDYAELRQTFRKEYIRTFCENAHADPEIADEMYPYITPREMAKLWACVYDWFEEGSEEAAAAAVWYETPNRSSIRDIADMDTVTRTKGGWIYYIGEDGTIYSETNDAGIIYEEGHPYLLVIMSDVPEDYELINPLTAVLMRAHECMIAESTE